MDPTEQGLNFGAALLLIKQGKRVTRIGWNGKNMWIALQPANEDSHMTRPYIYMKTVDNEFVPWVASQTDILAEDWAITGGNIG